MASGRSPLRGTYVLYPPRVTRRSFVEGFRVHDEPTRHVRGSLRSRLSLPRRNIESRYLRSLVSRPRRSRVRNTRREHATCVRVITRDTADLFRLSRLRERVRHTCTRGRQYYFTGFRQMGMIHAPDDVCKRTKRGTRTHTSRRSRRLAILIKLN